LRRVHWIARVLCHQAMFVAEKHVQG
jgi:hypothetical protein